MNYALSNKQVKKYYGLYYFYHIRVYMILGLVFCVGALYNFLIEKFYENKFSIESLLIVVVFIIECLFFIVKFIITRKRYLHSIGLCEEVKNISYSFLLIENEFHLVNDITKKALVFNKSVIKNVVLYKQILIIHIVGEGIFVPNEEQIKDLLKEYIK